MSFISRFANIMDEGKILHLYKLVAKNVGGIAREEDEINHDYILNNLQKSLKNGVCLLLENPDDTKEIIAEIHCYKLEPRVFHHVLSELTIVVHPNFQNKGLGKLLFTDLFNYIETNRNDILRVELIARESNIKAISFYQKLGFKIEGRLEKRINNAADAFEADIPMAWFNTSFKNNIKTEKMFPVKIASNQNLIDQIIDLRYVVLRQPWNKPKDTVTDDLELSSVNAYIEIDGKVIACGRLQDNGSGLGQIRYMSVHPDYQGKGLGKLIVTQLEEEAKNLTLNTIELQARENAVEFYKSQGYVIKETSFKLWDIIQHYLMTKTIK